MSWTAEKEKKLRELWKKGHSASQIAGMLEGTTRNAGKKDHQKNNRYFSIHGILHIVLC